MKIKFTRGKESENCISKNKILPLLYFFWLLIYCRSLPSRKESTMKYEFYQQSGQCISTFSFSGDTQKFVDLEI
jgi:hypothetical protein